MAQVIVEDLQCQVAVRYQLQRHKLKCTDPGVISGIQRHNDESTNVLSSQSCSL